MLGGYYVHGWAALWLGVFDGAPLAAPEGLVGALLRLAVAALVAGYVAGVLSGGSTRTARLLGIALAAIAILAAISQVEQGRPLLTGHLAQVLTAPLCRAGAALLARHRRLLARPDTTSSDRPVEARHGGAS